MEVVELTLERRAAKLLGREHLAAFVVTTIGGTERAPTFEWSVDRAKRRELERYVARTRTQRAASFVRGYYRAPRRPPPGPWRDLAEVCLLVPAGLALAAYAIRLGFGS
jgi:hypothetical protein